MASDLLNKMMDRGGFSNSDAIEKKRQELAAAVTRVVINEAMAEMRARKAEIERMSVKTDDGAKKD